MEALQEGIDTLQSLEERITRAVQAISNLRSENTQLHEQLKSAQQEIASVRVELEEAQTLSEEFQKDANASQQKIGELSQELETLRGERKQVKTRIEKLLNQLDLLSAS